MDRERERVLSAYERLRVHHPALPPNLRDFQVVFHMKRRNFEGEFLFEQVDLISAMTNSEARDHLLGALPTGYGKSLPMLVASLLLPPGIECENLLAVLKFDFHRLDNCCHLSFDHHCPTAHERLQQVRHQRSCWTSGMWQSSIQLKIF